MVNSHSNPMACMICVYFCGVQAENVSFFFEFLPPFMCYHVRKRALADFYLHQICSNDGTIKMFHLKCNLFFYRKGQR